MVLFFRLFLSFIFVSSKFQPNRIAKPCEFVLVFHSIYKSSNKKDLLLPLHLLFGLVFLSLIQLLHRFSFIQIIFFCSAAIKSIGRYCKFLNKLNIILLLSFSRCSIFRIFCCCFLLFGK